MKDYVKNHYNVPEFTSNRLEMQEKTMNTELL